MMAVPASVNDTAAVTPLVDHSAPLDHCAVCTHTQHNTQFSFKCPIFYGKLKVTCRIFFVTSQISFRHSTTMAAETNSPSLIHLHLNNYNTLVFFVLICLHNHLQEKWLWRLGQCKTFPTRCIQRQHTSPQCCHLINWMKHVLSLILAHSLHYVMTSFTKTEVRGGLSHGHR